jgi:hypothetical protein
VPLSDWFRRELKDNVFESIELLRIHVKNADISLYQKIINEHMNKEKDHSDKIWSMIVLTSWIDQQRLRW